MAKSTDITYYADATAKCQNCNSVYTLGMTVENLSLEICGNCHPFYTGKETLIDTAGRIEKFNERLSKGGSKTSKSKKVKKRKTIQTLADLATDQEEAKPEKKVVKKAPAEKIEKKNEEIKETVAEETPEKVEEVAVNNDSDNTPENTEEKADS